MERHPPSGRWPAALGRPAPWPWLPRLAAGLATIAFVTPSLASEYEYGEVQIELTPGVSIETINARYDTVTLDSLPPLFLLDLPEGADELQYIQQMQADPDIVEAEFSYNNETPEGTRQMVVAAVGGTIEDYLDQNLVTRIHLPDIHQRTTGEGVLVAVLDTGVRMDHPALEGSILPNGWDFVDNDGDPSDTSNGIDDDEDDEVDEGAGHGTMVAGIIRLVAPDAKILPIRILDDEGRGSTFTVAKGIRYAVEQGAHVVNLSLGLQSHCNTIDHELEGAAHLNIAMIGAAGNDGTDHGLFPASDSKVLMVAALDSSDIKADFSNYDSGVAISAPGVGILAPYHDGEYAIGAGTSFAAPFIAGQCALILSEEPGLDPDWLKLQVGGGVIDIYDIPENWPFEGELGTGRFDGAELLLVLPAPASTRDTADQAASLRATPNPSFRGEPVSVLWEVPVAGRGTPGDEAAPRIAVFDARGRQIRTLAAAPGAGSIRWDGRDQAGRPVPAGAYFLRLVAGDTAQRARVVRLD